MSGYLGGPRDGARPGGMGWTRVDERARDAGSEDARDRPTCLCSRPKIPVVQLGLGRDTVKQVRSLSMRQTMTIHQIQPKD